MRHTGIGKDGTHTFSSKYGNAECVRYIVRLFDAFCNGEPLPLDINHGRFVLLQKSDRDDDRYLSADGIYMHPGDLRPLTSKHCDNKCVAGIRNWIVTPVVRTFAFSFQNGFATGRIFLNCVVDLDLAAGRDSLNFWDTLDRAGLRFGTNLILARKG